MKLKVGRVWLGGDVMREPIGLAIFAALLAWTVLLASPAPAVAQTASSCRQIAVNGVRLRRVDLYTLRGEYSRTVARDELGAISSATQCDAAPEYLRIEAGGARWLVRRSALDLPSSIELPPCAANRHESGENRNASSSGLGGAVCRSD